VRRRVGVPIVVAWWLDYEWRRVLFGEPMPPSDDLPSADLAREVSLSEKLALLDDERALRDGE
jgi:hypothetical protein